VRAPQRETARHHAVKVTRGVAEAAHSGRRATIGVSELAHLILSCEGGHANGQSGMYTLPRAASTRGRTRLCQECYGKCRLCGAPTTLLKPGIFRPYCHGCEFYNGRPRYTCYRCGKDRTGRHPTYCAACLDEDARERRQAATWQRELDARRHEWPSHGKLSAMKRARPTSHPRQPLTRCASR
jgi:hypothetical protein